MLLFANWSGYKLNCGFLSSPPWDLTFPCVLHRGLPLCGKGEENRLWFFYQTPQFLDCLEWMFFCLNDESWNFVSMSLWFLVPFFFFFLKSLLNFHFLIYVLFHCVHEDSSLTLLGKRIWWRSLNVPGAGDNSTGIKFLRNNLDKISSVPALHFKQRSDFRSSLLNVLLWLNNFCCFELKYLLKQWETGAKPDGLFGWLP